MAARRWLGRSGARRRWKRKHVRPEVVFTCFDVARRLLKYTRATRPLPDRRILRPEVISDRLHRVLVWHLSTFDYSRRPKSQSAEMARKLAAIIGDIDRASDGVHPERWTSRRASPCRK